MALFGADVDELNALANQMDQASRTLATSRARISAQVSNSAWVGPVADRFRSEWSSTNSRRIVSAVDLLSSAATTLHQNAQEQTRASAADHPAISGSLTFGDAGMDPVGRFGDLLGILGNGAESIGDINLLSDLHVLNGSFLKPLDKYLGPIGFALSAAAVAVDVREHDAIGALMDGVSGLAAGVTSLAPVLTPVIGLAAVTGLSVVGAGIGVGVAFVQATLPYSLSSQDAMVKYVVQEHFGPQAKVDPEHLTAEQSQYMSGRYDDPFGVAQMISDKMNQSGEPIQHASAVTSQWVADTAVPAVEHAASDVGHAAEQFGGFVASLAKGIKL